MPFKHSASAYCIDAALNQPVNIGGGSLRQHSPPDQQAKLLAFSRCQKLRSHWIDSVYDKSEPDRGLSGNITGKKKLTLAQKLGFVQKIQDRQAMDYSVCSIAGCGIPGHQDGNRKMCKMNCPSGVCVSCALRPPPPLPAAAGLPPHADFSLAIH